MAVPTVTGFTVIDAADSATGWVSIGGGPGGGLDNDTFIQGTGAFGRRGNATDGRGIGFNTGAIDLQDSAGEALFNWLNVALGPGGLHNITDATPGLSLRVGSDAGGTTNFADFAIGGADVTPSGWKLRVLQPESLVSWNSAGTVVWSSIDFVGLFPNWVSVPGGNINHFVMDSFGRAGALEITGGDSGDRITWEELRQATEETGTPDQLWGIIQQEASGNLLLNGKLQFGDLAGSVDCYFEDQDQIITFEEQFYHDGTFFAPSVPDDFMGITIVNDTGTCEWQDGIKVGSDLGRNGSIFAKPAVSVEGNVRLPAGDSLNGLHFVATDADVDNVQLYGSQFRRVDQALALSADATNGPNFEAMSALFQSAFQLTPGRAVVRNTSFVGYREGARAALEWNANVDVEDCPFLANTDGVTDKDIGHVWQFDASGPTYVDETVDANDVGDADWVLFPSTAIAGDILYIGHRLSFDRAEFDNANGTAGVDGGSLAVVAEYWNGASWSTLTPTTNGLGTPYFTVAVTDDQNFAFDPPSDWQRVIIGDLVEGGAGAGFPMFWIRFRITAGTYSTEPVYDQGRIEAFPAAVEIDSSGTKTFTGMTFSGNDDDVNNTAGVGITVSQV